jgi:hypothetical protein
MGPRPTYAKHTSALFKEMEQHAKKLFDDAGYGHLIKTSSMTTKERFWLTMSFWSVQILNISSLSLWSR